MGHPVGGTQWSYQVFNFLQIGKTQAKTKVVSKNNLLILEEKRKGETFAHNLVQLHNNQHNRDQT